MIGVMEQKLTVSFRGRWFSRCPVGTNAATPQPLAVHSRYGALRFLYTDMKNVPINYNDLYCFRRINIILILLIQRNTEKI